MNYLDINVGALTDTKAIQISQGVQDAGKLIATDATGRLDASFFDFNLENHEFSAIASEDIATGDLINFFDNGGTLNLRKADNSLNRPSHGQIKQAVLSGEVGTGVNGSTLTRFAGLSLGTTYYLSLSGAVTATLPTTPGYTLQEIGIAVSATRIKTENFEIIVIA